MRHIYVMMLSGKRWIIFMEMFGQVIIYAEQSLIITGNTLHVGIGSDLDGGYGKEQCPYDLETIADLENISALLSKRGYSNDDIENIMHKNWIRFLRNAWKIGR